MAEPAPERLIDPDCRDGKHGSCVGGPCECMCHDDPERTPPDDITAPDQRPASMRRRIDFDTGPEPTIAPVTAENLRERIAWLRDRWYQRPGLSEQADALDAALDEFADDAPETTPDALTEETETDE